MTEALLPSGATEPGEVVDGSVTSFDRDEYTKLVGFIDAVDKDLENRFLAPRSGAMLDSSLGGFVKPGSTAWQPVQLITNGANAFGGSVFSHLSTVSDSWTAFLQALKDARDTLEKQGDLASMSAEQFLKDFPAFGNSNG